MPGRRTGRMGRKAAPAMPLVDTQATASALFLPLCPRGSDQRAAPCQDVA